MARKKPEIPTAVKLRLATGAYQRLIKAENYLRMASVTFRILGMKNFAEWCIKKAEAIRREAENLKEAIEWEVIAEMRENSSGAHSATG